VDFLKTSGGFMKRGSIAILILAVMLPAQILAAEAPKRGGKVIFAMESDITTMNPFVRMTSTDQRIRGNLYESLLDFDLKNNIVPSLAESWTISSDGLHYTLRLRRGVKFHNGQEMMADDVKWSAEYVMMPENASTGFATMSDVKSVMALDRYTVKFTLKGRTGSFLAALANTRTFVVVPKGSVPPNAKTVPAFPPGTGPFVYKEWKQGRETIFVRNKDYWQRGLPYLEELIFKPVEEPMVRFTSLRAGDVHMIERTPYSFVSKITAGEIAGIRFVEARASAYRRILFNVLEPPFNNPKLRMAVAYAIDKKQYLQGAFWNYGTPADQLFLPTSPWFVKMPQVHRDLAKVKSLLKDAGVEGEFEFELSAQRGDEEEQQILQRQLATAGIKMKIILMEYATYQEKDRRGEFQATLAGASLEPDPHLAYMRLYGCHGLEEAKAKRRFHNRSGYCNRDVDKMLEEAAFLTDQKRRYELYAKAVPMIYSDYPEIPVAFIARFFSYQDKIKGFATNEQGSINTTQFGLSRAWLER